MTQQTNTNTKDKKLEVCEKHKINYTSKYYQFKLK